MKTYEQLKAELAKNVLHSREVIVILRNRPTDNEPQYLVESVVETLEEGKTKKLSGGYSTRLDRRPESQGGDQLHIDGPGGKAWAYRYNGARSEPRKYTLPTTNRIRSIVADTFGIPRDCIEEVLVIDATEARILVEVVLV